MPTRPWFPLNPGDYQRDTQHLSLEEHGAYLLLIFHAWNHEGYLPLDMRRIAQILGVHTNKAKTLWGLVGGYWYQTPGGYRQGRLDKELAHAVEISEKRRKAAEARYAAKAPANAHTIHNPHSLGVPKERGADAPAPKKSTKGTRWTDDHVPMEWIEWARREHPEVDDRAQAVIFVDHWRSTTKNPTKTDWPATWRNWIRREVKNGKARTNGSTNSGKRRLSAPEQVIEAYNREFAADEKANRESVGADDWHLRLSVDE